MILPVSAIHLGTVGDIATAIVAAATVALFFAAVWAGRTAQAQIAEQRAIASRKRVYDHLGIFNSRSFTETSGEAERVFRQFKDDGADGKAIWEKVSRSEKVAVQTVLNFYEEIANEYNAGFLDPEASEPLVFVTVFMWQQAREAVEWLRRGERRFMEQWENLYNAKSAALPPPLDPIDHEQTH